MSELTEQEHDLLHPVVAIEEVAPATFHATYRDGGRVEIVAETIAEALMVAETPDGFVVPEDEVLRCLNPIWLATIRPHVGDPVVFTLLASIEERIEAIGHEEGEVARWVATHVEVA